MSVNFFGSIITANNASSKHSMKSSVRSTISSVIDSRVFGKCRNLYARAISQTIKLKKDIGPWPGSAGPASGSNIGRKNVALPVCDGTATGQGSESGSSVKSRGTDDGPTTSPSAACLLVENSLFSQA